MSVWTKKRIYLGLVPIAHKRVKKEINYYRLIQSLLYFSYTSEEYMLLDTKPLSSVLFGYNKKAWPWKIVECLICATLKTLIQPVCRFR